MTETTDDRMMNTTLLRVIALTVFLVCAPTTLAAKSLTLGASLNGSGWEGDNGSGNPDFESDKGGQFGVSLNFRVDKFYTGLSLQNGTYEFGSDGPTQFTSNGVLASNDVKVEHSDFDLLFGYYFWPNVSLFVDFKVMHSEWRDTGYEQAFSGLGAGVSGFYPLNEEWLLFGSFGVVDGDIDDDDDNSGHGDGNSTVISAGAVYRIDKSNTVNFGLRLRNYDFDYEDGNSQEYDINAIFVGYNHSFNFND